MPGPVHLVKKQKAVEIGDFAICQRGRLGLVTSIGVTPKGAIKARGVTLLPLKYSGGSWSSIKPRIVHRLGGEAISNLGIHEEER